MKCEHFRVAAIAAMLLVTASAWADGSHHGSRLAFGRPGAEAEVTKTIRVEARDDMRFIFDRTDIRRGDVVRFIVTNAGKIRHEFTIGDAAYQRIHGAEMAKMPGMTHNEPHSATLEPGTSKTLIWKFDTAVASELVFSCNEPGHFTAGMVQRIKLQS